MGQFKASFEIYPQLLKLILDLEVPILSNMWRGANQLLSACFEGEFSNIVLAFCFLHYKISQVKSGYFLGFLLILIRNNFYAYCVSFFYIQVNVCMFHHPLDPIKCG